MAKLFFGMNQSLDGYVDHMAFGSGPTLFRHLIDQTGGLAGSIYGRRLYEIMRLGRGSAPGRRGPQDIEWLTIGERLFIVQARPYLRGH